MCGIHFLDVLRLLQMGRKWVGKKNTKSWKTLVEELAIKILGCQEILKPVWLKDMETKRI